MPMIMNCSIKLPLFPISLLIFLSFFLYPNIVSCIEPSFEYSTHCKHVVREAKPADEELNVSQFPARQDGYYSGGDKILNPIPISNGSYYSPVSKVLTFKAHHVYTTDVEDILKVEGSLIFQTSNYYESSYSSGWSSYTYSSSSSSLSRGDLAFDFQGFWSRKSGKLCIVGSAYTRSKEGKRLHLAAVVKFNNLKVSSNINTLVTATMDCLYSADEPNYFDQISLMMFPQVSYKYTMVSNQFSQGCPGATDVSEKSSLSLSRSTTICDMFYSGDNVYEMEYASDCNSSKNCNPFGDGIGYLPQFMSLSMIKCYEDKQELRFLIKLPNRIDGGFYSSFNFSTSLVGEGSWDAKKNRLCVAACRIFDASNSLEKSHVGDCTTRLSLRFPTILSIRNRSNAVGEIWSTKHRNESGFFERIVLRNSDDYLGGGIQLQGLKYEYKVTEKVKKSCEKKESKSNSRGQYPDGYSRDMSFHFSTVKGSKEGFGYCNSHPFAIGNQPYQTFPYLFPWSSPRPYTEELETRGSLLNISYKMSFQLPSSKSFDGLNLFHHSSNGYQDIQISAEGTYDAETGYLCMVGCRELRSDKTAYLNHSIDCEILVNVQFPPTNSDRRRSKIKGSLKSMRDKTDHLHFEPLEFSGRAYYMSWAEESVRRVNCELIVSVISNTLVIVFVALQIFHMRKNPDVSPFVSLLMLVILALRNLVTLVLNLEAMFNQDSERSSWGRSGTWLEMNEVIVRVVTMVAFLLQVRLLMLSWTARCSDDKKKALWIAEKKVLFVCLPVYISGAIVAFYVKRRNSSYYLEKEQIFLGASRAYAGLILDAFLFPQIIFNMFQNSKEQALSPFFYIGLTLVRLVPHGYDLYRAHNFEDVNDSYIYADPSADYYSTAWDCIIPVLGLSFAAILHLQQRAGGRYFLPKRFQASVTYEKLPMDSEDQSATKI